MRRAEEQKLWSNLKKSRHGRRSPVSVGNITLDVSSPCIVLGGRNGAGKSRLLRSLDEQLGDGAIYVDLHHLCEQALIVLRSRDDFNEMKDEFEVLGPDADRRSDVERIIGREYDSIDWYALEIEPSDSEAADRFTWGGEQPLLPFFHVQYRGLEYTSREMGLGEFSVHFLFWILEQYRETEEIVVLLDEPDAFLPPVGVASLLIRLLRICRERDWAIVMATHSAEMIDLALTEQAFVLLHSEEDGTTSSIHSVDDPAVADRLLARPSTRNVIFVEDESAWHLSTALVEAMDPRFASSTLIVWGNGSGYLVELQKHIPRPPRAEMNFVLLFDGDQRQVIVPATGKRWPAMFLPTERDPDELFKSNRSDVASLASRLNATVQELKIFLDSIEGQDPHDWVNDLGHKYGRASTLRALSELWVERNMLSVEPFLASLRQALLTSSRP